jgi:hypothetical protein
LTDTFFENAGRWFVTSGIQEESGGVARYYRSDLGRNARVSTEITGYSASALAYLAERTADAGFLAAAQRAASFLARRAWDPGARIFPFEDGGEALGYFFDSGIIIRGLLAVWRLTGEEHLRTLACEAGETTRVHFSARGHYHPILRLPSLEALPYTAQWSRGPGCYQLKVALAWYELYEELGDERFLAWYEELAAWAMDRHRTFLTEVTERPKRMDRLHAYSYFLEGLLPIATRPDAARALAEGLESAAYHLRDIAPEFERSDVPAQLLRVRLFAHEVGAVRLDHAAAAEEAARAAAFQLSSADPRIHHGFAFGRNGSDLLPYVNPVSTAFCLQALDLWRRFRAGETLPRWTVLI